MKQVNGQGNGINGQVGVVKIGPNPSFTLNNVLEDHLSGTNIEKAYMINC